ncbi:hypothetical protein [Pseudoalteromonas ardens]|uniref:hypothetical protein n=1 Tax=Pseudoalteromonas ardens TaxID=3048490 RepID=UPI0024C24226|nr:hypothetical protein [Pseudoalteromonas sp. R96]MDK1313631.1 hypothetical protein [Pseudoalteromonas sp. R96]
MKLKKTSPLLILLGVSSVNQAYASSSDIELIHQFHSEIYTEAQPVKAFVEDFDKPLTHGDSAFTYNVFELGMKYKGIGFGAQSRFDYLLAFDPDTARYTHTEKNDLPFERRNYRYYLRGKQATTNGVFLSYDFTLLDERLVITPKFTYFQSTHFQDAIVDGTIFADEIEGKLQTEYYFSKDILFKSFTPTENPEGEGYSFDLALSWQITPDLDIWAAAKDLMYETKYEGVGFVNGFTTDIPFTEREDGIDTTPSVRLRTSAYDQEIEYTFEQNARYYLGVNYRINNQFSTTLKARKFIDDTFVQATVSYHFGESWELFGGYETHSEAFELGIKTRHAGISVKMDNPDIEDAHYVNLNWFLNLAF